MSDEPLVTPPVHDDGPAAPDREIEGGEASRTGFDSRLFDALRTMADELAVKHTSMPIVVPARQIADVVNKLLPDLPRIPDYDTVSAPERRWAEATFYSPSELPDTTPSTMGVYANDSEQVCVPVTIDGVTTTLTLDFAQAQDFFLAGLGAVEYVKAQRGPQYLTPSGLTPLDFVKAGPA
jgi:hypothetical protein